MKKKLAAMLFGAAIVSSLMIACSTQGEDKKASTNIGKETQEEGKEAPTNIPTNTPTNRGMENVDAKNSYNYYFGVPHAHTSYSDGTDGGGETNPQGAYEHGKELSKLDFLFITDHSNMLEGDLYNEEKNEFTEAEGSEWQKTRQQAEASTTDSFLAGRGFEMTSSSTNGGQNYGHINVYGTDNYVEAETTMQDLHEFYSWLGKQEGAIAMFNHPNRPASSFEYLKYNEAMDDIIQMIEVGNGSMGSNYLDSEAYYYKALDYGWHLAPVNSQDNHSTNWGDADNLTAIIAEELTLEGYYDALRNRRVYSTETRNLKLEVYANEQIMGSELEVSKGDNIHFDIKASDPEEKIARIEIISNGAKTVAEKNFDEPVNEAVFETDITVGEGKNWYVVKVTHEDGRVGIGSANYADVSDEDVKIVNLSLSSEFISLNSATEISVQLLNAGAKAYSGGAQINFYFNDKLIGTHEVEEALEAGELRTFTVEFAPSDATGASQIRAELIAEAEGSVKDLTKDVTVIAPNGKKVVFDNSHKNIGVVNGTMLEFSEVLRLYGYQVSFNTEEITSDLLKDVDVLILNTPTKDPADGPSNKLTDEEEKAVAEFVKNGGGLLYATQSTEQNTYDPTQYNTLLEELGSDIRFNYGGVNEKSAEYQDNKNAQSFYAKNYPESSLNISDDMYALRIYRGTALVSAEGGALVSDSEKNLEILAAANKTSYTVKNEEYGYHYAGAEEENGEIIPLVAAQKIGNGNIIVSGRYAYSNYEIANDASNGAFFLKAVNYLAKLEDYTAIADVSSVEVGESISVEGIVVANSEGRANTFYVQDASGETIAVVGTQTGSLPLEEGIRVIVNGRVELLNGEKVIAYQSYDHQVLYIGASQN